MNLLPPTRRNPITINTQVATLRRWADLGGRAVLFPAWARAAKFAFLRLMSALVGCMANDGLNVKMSIVE